METNLLGITVVVLRWEHYHIVLVSNYADGKVYGVVKAVHVDKNDAIRFLVAVNQPKVVVTQVADDSLGVTEVKTVSDCIHFISVSFQDVELHTEC